MSESFRKCTVEFIGTFFLVFTIALTGNPIAIGAILMTMIYMGGYISGAHYNPAVTLAVLLRDKIEQSLALKYMLFQLLGAIAASLVFWLIKGTPFVPKPDAILPYTNAIVIEILYTFALASVVLHVATSEKQNGNQFYGLAIGFTVMAAAFAGGPISGGAFNPAVGVGPILVDFTHIADNLANMILYLVGPMAGAALAAFVYNLTTKRK
jgi:aquaporin Z